MAFGKTGHRRGFFFTMISLAILSFMLLSMQVWMRTFEKTDENSAMRFKGEAIRLVLASLSDGSLTHFANASAYFATYKLANYTAYTGLVYTAANDSVNNPGTGLVEQTIRDLMMNGSSEPEAGKLINYTESEKESYTVVSWKDKINRAANLMGFKVSLSDPQDINIRQIDAWTVGVAFDMDMTVSDLEGTMRQSKKMHADANFSIDGFPDPSITRNDIRQRNPHPLPENAVQKQIFRHQAYSGPFSLKPNLLGSMDEGNGWFFGPITDYPPGTGTFTNATEQTRMWQYIYVTQYYDGLVDDANRYGAVILTETPGTNVTPDVVLGGCIYNMTEQTKCLNCRRTFESSTPGCHRDDEYFNNVSVPYIAGGFSASDATDIGRAGMEGQNRLVLMDNTYGSYTRKAEGYHSVWDLTKIRDMAICGFYVEYDGAPSFFQRMLRSVGNSTAGTVKSDYGIETLLVSSWAGGLDDNGGGTNFDHDLRSRLDWQFYSANGNFPADTTWKVKGMAGCRDERMCQGSNMTTGMNGTGKFRLPEDDIVRYGLKPIACRKDPGTPTSYCEPGHD